MGNIVLLDELTINKIAAGEVVDKPASIVKELVENSIDAKANNIVVEIKNGGISYIRITDNGTGIASDDVEMAFERHATSKIRKEDDLRKVTSMGFRGEALASVASISKIKLVTKKKDEPVGTKIEIEAGSVKSIEQVASNQGTTIEIRDVFYNVPARFKFLKKDFTEAGYIEDVISRMAIIHPEISFKYINNGKTLIQTNGNSDIKTAVYNIFGKDIYENVLETSYEYENIKVEGVVGLPKIARSTRSQQFTYVNSRYVKDRTISVAIEKAYNQQLEINKFGFVVLNIKINPENIDVNVHPAKLEIKFSNESQVFEAIYYAIKNALENHNKRSSPFTNTRSNYYSNDIISNYSNNKKTTFTPNQVEKVLNIFDKSLSVSKNNDIPELKKEEKEQKSVEHTYEIEHKEDILVVDSVAENIEIQDKYSVNINIGSVIEEVSDIVGINDSNNKNIEKYEDIKISATIKEEKETVSQSYKYIGSVFNTYIIIEINDKMYIIDQHAAHERLIFENIKQNYYSKQRQTQMLLIPIVVELTPKEKNIVYDNMSMFEAIGYIIEEFGDNSIKISGVPSVGFDIDFKSMLMDTVDELMGSTKTNAQDKEFRFLATVACKAAIKANMKLTGTEHRTLINDMMKLDRPFTCPHGRPTAYEISKYEIEKKFLRK